MNNKKNLIGKIFLGVGYAIVGLLIALVLWLSIDKFILKSPVPSIFGYSALSVETGSMEPTISEGDVVIIKDTGDYKIGDIITFLHEGEEIPTTHRIIQIENGEYVTRGDFNNSKDSLNVKENEIIGEVVGEIPHLGLFARWMKQENGWVYIAIIILTFVLGGYFIKNIDKENKEVKFEEKEEK